MTDLVIDASVAIKWVIAECGTMEALALRRGNRLFAPELLVAECANALWRKARLAELTEDEAVFAARLLQRADIELMPMRPLLERATRLAIALDHPAYDCLYLALAESLSCDLATADERFAAKSLPTDCRSKVLPLAAS
ncbi:MAG: type II toxin-antitoxin system VapC family toxin [Stellaceae bacterium]